MLKPEQQKAKAKFSPDALRGVELREGRSKDSIRIQFSYRGITCRETLKLSHTKQNVEYAIRRRAEILNAIERGTFNYHDYFPNSKFAKRLGLLPEPLETRLTGEMLRMYLQTVQDSLSPSTASRYMRVCHTHLFPRWDKTPLTELDAASLRDWIKTLDCKLKTIRNILSPLRGMLDQAMNDGLIQRNPLDALKLARLVPRDARKSSFTCDPFSMEEITAILDACEDDERPLWQFAFATGVRTSELIALESEQLDFKRLKIKIDRVKIEREVHSYTKTGAGKRDIDMTQGAYDALVAVGTIPLHQHEKNKPVFIDKRHGKTWANDHALYKRWRRVLEKAGVRYRNPYQTRHTFASTLLSSGENMLYVAKQMGHKDLSMLNRHYAQWIEQGSDPETRDALAAFFKKASTGKS